MNRRKIKLNEDLLIRSLREKTDLGSRALYDMYSASLFGVISRIVPDRSQAEDLLQETFIKVWYNFDKYDEARGRLFTWMVNLARNLAIDKVRSKDFRQQALQEELDKSVDIALDIPEVENRVDQKIIREGLGSLSTRERSVLELIYFKGFKHTEVAEALKMPLGSVKTCCRSGIFRLRAVYNTDLLQNAS